MSQHVTLNFFIFFNDGLKYDFIILAENPATCTEGEKCIIENNHNEFKLLELSSCINHNTVLCYRELSCLANISVETVLMTMKT